jgi:hypothetical protein
LEISTRTSEILPMCPWPFGLKNSIFNHTLQIWSQIYKNTSQICALENIFFLEKDSCEFYHKHW